MRSGAVIVAAGMDKCPEGSPAMLRLGNVSAVERMIAAFEKVGVSFILLVTDEKNRELEKQLAQSRVFFLQYEGRGAFSALEAARLGLERTRELCSRIFLAPAGTPLFLPSTLRLMEQKDKDIVIPVCNKQPGFPVLLSAEAAESVCADSRRGGIHSALSRCPLPKAKLPVEDRGVIVSAQDGQDSDLVDMQGSQLARAVVDVSIQGEKTLLDSRLVSLLHLVDETGSMRSACAISRISYSTAWNILNRAEEELGFDLLLRTQGGSGGSGCSLSIEGRRILEAYDRFLHALNLEARELFDVCFGDSVK